MASIKLNNVSKRFDRNEVIKDLSLEINDKELFVLVGPSGCGKSTVLRMIAGLTETSGGEIFIDKALVNGVAPKDRNISMVFQNYALYPHMNVYDNMALGLRMRGFSKKEIDARVSGAAEMLGIRELLDRRPGELSGGQHQRVAVGRSIVRRPKVFLFDEPLSNLDTKLRIQMRAELIELKSRLQTTMIYVTHDQVEAMTMGDRICVMHEGAVQQIARPLDLYRQPANQFVAEFMGQPSMNFFNMTVIERENSLWLDQGHFQLKIPKDIAAETHVKKGDKIVLGIRPEHIRDRLFRLETGSEGNTVLALVHWAEPIGSETFIHLESGGRRFVARVEAENPIQPNSLIEMTFDMRKAHLFSEETGRRLTSEPAVKQ